ncbi:hypothetical protein RXV86_03685 [Alisedimentitalea sp. MJ-SS2]|uniref:hypothetical protein n=1 Tax=Aliisedimentitalea sp. MJ-SS2 TaxID=3049795 RepID=UPI002914C456|nr:hypothetical protein [Alisedimentitalea sp. MJ-SS2]MDU8926479.1 hypothetical protein [Alisedimentitalea sp. MJ-SS2]
MSAIRLLWHKHRIVFVIFLAASAVTLFFVIRLAMFTIYWSDPAHRNLTPEPWMTPGYVAHSWGLPPHEIADFLDIPPGDRPTLAEIARSRNVPVSQIIEELSGILQDSK